MFTGIVEHIGRIERIERSSRGARVSITAPIDGLALGESVAVSGVCLTVTSSRDGGFDADVSAETLARSTLEHAAGGMRVNVERALRLADRLGGHLVSGHVDAVARMERRAATGDAVAMRFTLPRPIAHLVAAKGSIAVDGVSLTVNDVAEASFEVMLVPFTRGHTTLEELAPGGSVNLEADLLAKYVARLLGRGTTGDDSHDAGGVTLDLLRRSGYV